MACHTALCPAPRRQRVASSAPAAVPFFHPRWLMCIPCCVPCAADDAAAEAAPEQPEGN